MINYCNQQQIPVVFMFFRGCDGAPNQYARSYHSGETGDLQQVIRHLKHSGVERIALLGYSLGGNVTLKYLGEGNVDDAIVCASAVSVPLNLDVCAARMDQGFSRIYQHDLLKRLRHKVAQKKALLSAAGFDPDTRVRNFLEFDDAFTAPLHGFASGLDYYHRCSSRQFLRYIERPTLIIHAKDDPFMTPQVIPNPQELSSSIRFEVSEHGGHVGFIEKGILHQRNWLEPRIHRWLQQQMFGVS
jgi:predicted alpha/beta-fold hydrolase